MIDINKLINPDNNYSGKERLRYLQSHGTGNVGAYAYVPKSFDLIDLGSHMTNDIKQSINNSQSILYNNYGMINPMKVTDNDGENTTKYRDYKNSTGELLENTNDPLLKYHLGTDLDDKIKNHGYREMNIDEPRQFITRINRSSNRLGRAEVMNPLWQFNEMDDIRNDVLNPGYGRIFNNTLRRHMIRLTIKPVVLKYRKNPYHLAGMLKNDNSGNVRRYISGNRTAAILGATILGPFTYLKSVFNYVMGFRKIWWAVPDMGLFEQYFNQNARSLGLYLGLVDSNINAERYTMPKNEEDEFVNDEYYYKKDEREEEFKELLKSSTDSLQSDFPEFSFEDNDIAINKAILEKMEEEKERAAEANEDLNFWEKGIDYMSGLVNKGVNFFKQQFTGDDSNLSEDEIAEINFELELQKKMDSVDKELTEKVAKEATNFFKRSKAFVYKRKVSEDGLDDDLTENTITYDEHDMEMLSRKKEAAKKRKKEKISKDKKVELTKDTEITEMYIGGTSMISLGHFLPNWVAISNSAYEVTSNASELADKFQNIVSGAINYIPMRIENNVQVSYSISNATSSHPIEEMLNGMAQQAERDSYTANIDLSKLGQGFGNVGNMKDMMMNFATKKVTKAATAYTMGDVGKMIAGFGGKIELPEIFNGSNFSQSININFKFQSPLGDPISIFENVLIQRLLVETLATPMGAGKYSHLSPFCIQVDCPGFFNIGIGIIDNLSIDEGQEKNTRSIDNLSKMANMSVSIKNLDPVHSLTMDKGVFAEFRRINTNVDKILMNIANIPVSKYEFFLDRMILNLKKSKIKLKSLPNDLIANGSYAAQKFAKKIGLAALLRDSVKNNAVGYNPYYGGVEENSKNYKKH